MGVRVGHSWMLDLTRRTVLTVRRHNTLTFMVINMPISIYKKPTWFPDRTSCTQLVFGAGMIITSLAVLLL